MKASKVEKEIIQTAHAPAAIGTYSQAVRAGNTVYVSGQIPLDPVTMQVVSDDFKAQTEQVLKNLSAVAEAAGGSLKDFVKINVYLTDLKDFGIVNEMMALFFSKPYPARAAVQISALPRGVKVEIEGVMILE